MYIVLLAEFLLYSRVLQTMLVQASLQHTLLGFSFSCIGFHEILVTCYSPLVMPIDSVLNCLMLYKGDRATCVHKVLHSLENGLCLHIMHHLQID